MVVKERPRLVLLDLHMPQIDGFELMQRLELITGERRSIPFLVLTADATQETKRRALSVGGRGVEQRPGGGGDRRHRSGRGGRQAGAALRSLRPTRRRADMHGREVLEQLKSDDTTATIPVVIVSADATSDQVEQLTQAGAMEYQTKPIDIDRLLKTITGSLSAHSSVA
jgi:CheY-like chemotaxis protein